MQIFKSRSLSVKEIKQMAERDELDLTPEFQRREVWSDKARSFLIDTIVRGKPIPKVYIRTTENDATGKTVNEVVDGQQRLTTVLAFLQDAFPIKKIHHADLGGSYFSDLDGAVQKDILYYEFICDFLLDAPDPEIWEIFARLNKYPVKINDQEFRNSQWFGEFKTTVYELAREFTAFWLQNRIFTSKQLSRMGEAEFVSELLIAVSSGIKGKTKGVIDNAYQAWDEVYPSRITIMTRFRRTMDMIGDILQDTAPRSSFRRLPLFYTLFCAVYHLQYGLKGLRLKRAKIKPNDIPKVRIALEKVDKIFEVDKSEVSHLPKREREFRLATDVHTIHASNRTIRADYVVSLIRDVVKTKG